MPTPRVVLAPGVPFMAPSEGRHRWRRPAGLVRVDKWPVRRRSVRRPVEVMIRIKCRSCERLWGLSSAQAGQLFWCPGCGQEAVLPGPESATSSAADAVSPRAFLRPDANVTVPRRRAVPPRPAAEPAPERKPLPSGPRAPAGHVPAPELDDLPILEAVPDDEPVIELAEAAVPPPPPPEMTLRRTKRGKGKKKRNARFWEGRLEFQRTVLLSVIGVLFVWLVLGTIGIWAAKMYLVLLIFGFIIIGAGSTYYFFTRPDRAAGPFIVGACGVLYLASGLGLYAFHHWHELRGPRTIRDKEGNLPIDEEDARCEQLLGDSEKADALAWLQAPGVKHRFVLWQPEEAVENVKLVQQLGGKVWAVDIKNIRDGKGAQETWMLVVKLPSDREKRASLFQLKAKWLPSAEKASEHGQTYVLLPARDPRRMK